MQFFSKNKAIIEIVGVFIIIMFMYNFFFGGSSQGGVSIASSSPLAIGADLVKMSEDLSRATLSQQVFSSAGYLNLIDFTVPLPQQSVGRSNPFDPIGR